MPQTLFIPDEVKDSISRHLYAGTARAVEGYLSGNEDEDTLTGDMGACLRIGTQRVKVENVEIGGNWTWSLTYHKLRGRGRRASESFVGADGLFELSIKWNEQNEQKKSILFQAKNAWIGSDKSLLQQSIKLSTWREAAFVLNYTPTDYEAFSIDEVLRTRASRSQIEDTVSLGSLLSRDFLDCLIGDTDLRYDAKSRKLIWRAANGEMVETKFSIPHRFSVTVKPPKRFTRQKSRYREIPNTEVSNFRMQANDENILSLKMDHTEKDLSRAKKRLAQVYHPDNYSKLDPLFQDIMNKRMQDINNSHDVLYSKLKRKP